MSEKNCFNCGNAVLTLHGLFERCSLFGEITQKTGVCHGAYRSGTPQTMSDSEHLQASIARERSYMKKRMNESDDL
jgi:hypothetical protein